MMRYPREIEPETTIDALVQNIDYAPSFLDLAGAKVPEAIQGRSLRPLWKGKDPDWRDALYYHYYEYPHGWHYTKKHDGIRTRDYKLIHFYEIDEWELYDMEKDPTEMKNLYGKEGYEALTDSLKNELQQLRDKYEVWDGIFESE